MFVPEATTFTDVISAAISLVTDLNLMPVVAASAVAGVFAYLLRRAVKAVR